MRHRSVCAHARRMGRGMGPVGVCGGGACCCFPPGHGDVRGQTGLPVVRSVGDRCMGTCSRCVFVPVLSASCATRVVFEFVPAEPRIMKLLLCTVYPHPPFPCSMNVLVGCGHHSSFSLVVACPVLPVAHPSLSRVTPPFCFVVSYCSPTS